MTEVSFAKQFLTALDSRPIKISSDHVQDPKTYPAQAPTILPKQPTQKRKRTQPSSTTVPGSTHASTSSTTTFTITLKPMKSGTPTTLTLPAATTIFDLKAAYATAVYQDATRIKLLHAKKPCADSKTVAEVVGSDNAAPEFSVMVLGGAASAASAPTPPSPPVAVPEVEMGGVEGGAAGPVAQGPSGKEVLRTEEFWGDLKGFLVQRLRDEGEGERLAGLFREVWEKES